MAHLSFIEKPHKSLARGMTPIETQLLSQLAAQQIKRRHGLLLQLRAIVFLTRQGISIRGHSESEGIFLQLMHTWSKDNDIAISERTGM